MGARKSLTGLLLFFLLLSLASGTTLAADSGGESSFTGFYVAASPENGLDGRIELISARGADAGASDWAVSAGV